MLIAGGDLIFGQYVLHASIRFGMEAIYVLPVACGVLWRGKIGFPA